jgi:hypothetical protein
MADMMCSGGEVCVADKWTTSEAVSSSGGLLHLDIFMPGALRGSCYPPAVQSVPTTFMCVLLASVAAAQEPATTTTITIPVAIVRKNSRPLPSGFVAAKELLQVVEDSRPVDIVDIQRRDGERLFALVLDGTGSMRDKVEAVRQFAHRLLDRVPRRGVDQSLVAIFNGPAVTSTAYAEDPQPFLAHIDQFAAVGGRDIAPSVGQIVERAIHQNSFVVLVTDGEGFGSDTEVESMIRKAIAAKSVFFCVGLKNEGAGSAWKRGKQVLTELAEKTGGAAYFPSDLRELMDVRDSIATEVANSFQLTYKSELDAAQSRNIQVRLSPAMKQKDINVHAPTNWVSASR